MIRGKFQLQEVRNVYWNPNAKVLVFGASYDRNIPEDVNYSKATPTARLEMQVDNPAALAQFTLGEYYYFDATLVPKV